MRAQGFNVIGGSAFGDRLENDRAYGQQVLAGLGLNTAPVHEFARTASRATRFIDGNPGRYVLKFNGPDFEAQRQLCRPARRTAATSAPCSPRKLADHDGASASFILMDHVDGVEMGVGAYFDGEKFLAAPASTGSTSTSFPATWAS